MPIFTIPSTIYIAPVPPVPFTNDEIECKIEPPTAAPVDGLTPHANHYRAIVKYTVNYGTAPPGGITNLNIAITSPRNSFINASNGAVAPTAALTNVNTSPLGNQATMSWTVQNAPIGTYIFAVDFQPPFPLNTQLTASFDFMCAQMLEPVSVQLTYPKTV